MAGNQSVAREAPSYRARLNEWRAEDRDQFTLKQRIGSSDRDLPPLLFEYQGGPGQLPDCADRLGRIDPARLAPGNEFDGINPPLSMLDLVDVGMWLSEAQCQGSLGQFGFCAVGTQEFAETAVLG